MNFHSQIIAASNNRVKLPISNNAQREPLYAPRKTEVPYLLPTSPILKTLKVTLKQCGIPKKEFEQLKQFIEIKKRSKVVRKDAFRIDKYLCEIPRTIFCFSDENFDICDSYILAKTKNNAPVIGTGAQKRVTLAIHYETRRIHTCASGKFCDQTTPNEIEAHKILSNDKQYFVVGKTAIYEGTCNTSRKNSSNQEIEVGEVKKFCIFTELMPFGTLEKWIPQLHKNKPRLLEIIDRILVIVDHLHSQYGLVHGDIKPENFFFDEKGNIKLGDFGFTEKIGKESEVKGSPKYAAPELFNNKDKLFPTTEKSDLWSLGVIFAQISHQDNWFQSRILWN